MKELEMTITHIKILDTISNLNKQGMYPLSDGVYKIVAGIVDDETANLRDEPTFGTLISFNSKKVCRYLLALQRYGYIKKIYNKSRDNLYYATTELVLTNKKVIEKYGLVSIHCDEMGLDKIENITVNCSFWGRIFGYGNVCIQGTNRNNINFCGVRKPEVVRKTINNHRG